MNMTKKRFYLYLISMELVIVLSGIIISYFSKVPLFPMKTDFINIPIFILAIAGGICLGTVPRLFAQTSLFKTTYNKLIQSFIPFKLNFLDCIVISLCAGVCEELLFRGALQPLLGIFITSVIFLVIHGYFDPRDWKKTILGTTALIFSILAGFLFMFYGLIPAIIFHFSYDFTAYSIIMLEQKKTGDMEIFSS